MVLRVFTGELGDHDFPTSVVLYGEGGRGTRDQDFLPDSVVCILTFGGFLVYAKRQPIYFCVSR